MANEETKPIVPGSNQTIEITITEDVNGTVGPMDLTGIAVVFRMMLPGGTVIDRTAVVDPNQNGNRGKVRYKLLTTDIPNKAGRIRIQPIPAVGGDVFPMQIFDHYVVESLPAP